MSIAYVIHNPRSREARLFTFRQNAQLVENGDAHALDHDAIPCVYLVGRTKKYLISEICAEKPGFAYGIIESEKKGIFVGAFELEELYRIHEKEEFFVNDLGYETKHKLSVFVQVANEFGRLLVDDEIFEQEFQKYCIE